ncbi:MAG: phosphoglycerate kinase [bacterium]|nr:phosphoglycerate kinase [bacterium]
MRSLRDIELKGKRVLMRVDFNVPIEAGEITDDTRIRAVIPTIQYILNKGSKLIIMSHLGRPKGKRVESMSLKPVAEQLSKLLGKPVKFMPCCIGKENEKATHTMQDGDVMLLENTRFHPEEEANDSKYGKELAKLGDVYVNDAFGAAHRAHASVEAVTHYFDIKVPGFLMEKELKYLGGLLKSPRKPFIALLGGAKISGKIDVINNLLPVVDKLLLGGGMAFTFFKSMGYGVGSSILEEDKLTLAKEIVDKWKHKLLLPSDVVCAAKFDKEAEKKVVAAQTIPDGWVGLDIGPNTVTQYTEILSSANTVFWNGPMGVFEFTRFENGTKAIAKKIAEVTKRGGITVIGGGDTVAAVNKFEMSSQITHISTGGGASLELLSGIKLPGVEALG